MKDKKSEIQALIKALKKLFPNAGIALNFSNDWELVVAVILSAQTTDKQVNKVTENLFKKYKNISDYAESKLINFEKDINSIGLYKSKAKNITELAKIILNKYNGKIPNTIGELVELPGIGRKTANVVMGVIHKNPVGITVDTHVRRFVIRFGLSKFKDPKRIEQDLIKIVPKKDWEFITFGLIEYGRNICPARKHECKDHPLTKIFPKADKIWPKAK